MRTFVDLMAMIDVSLDNIDALYQESEEKNSLKYHTFTNHVYPMVALMANHFNESTMSAYEEMLLSGAALFHDIVYVPGRKDNEYLSAEVFIRMFQNNLPFEMVTRIAQLIRCTTIEYHLMEKLPEGHDPLLPILLDFDLLSMAFEYDEFVEQQELIIQEYKATRSQQAEFLKKFLEKERIFKSSIIDPKAEVQAKENIKRFIEETV